MSQVPPGLVNQFAEAVACLDDYFASRREQLADPNQASEVRRWLDGESPLEWSGPGITPDEWFFITTLYGETSLAGKRTHIRAFFPMFVQAANRDIRNLTPGLVGDWRLRSGWMKNRLCNMGALLRDRGLSMTGYTDQLREAEKSASPGNPVPALDMIVGDLRATGWKTLSVFVRDCVQGNSFPIDSRVQKELTKHRLPTGERLLVSLCLSIGRNPRQVARMFYAAGGQGSGA